MSILRDFVNPTDGVCTGSTKYVGCGNNQYECDPAGQYINCSEACKNSYSSPCMSSGGTKVGDCNSCPPDTSGPKPDDGLGGNAFKNCKKFMVKGTSMCPQNNNSTECVKNYCKKNNGDSDCENQAFVCGTDYCMGYTLGPECGGNPNPPDPNPPDPNPNPPDPDPNPPDPDPNPPDPDPNPPDPNPVNPVNPVNPIKPVVDMPTTSLGWINSFWN
jgi:hypothetical protein